MNFDLIMNCDTLISDQRSLIMRYLYLRVATDVRLLELELE